MKQLYRANFLARKVTLIYVIVSGLWILLSDYFLDTFLPETETLKISILKGLLFVSVTAILLYVLIRTGERSRLQLYNLLVDIIEGTSDAIFVKDQNGQYLVINSSAANAVGKIPSDIIGKDDRALFSEQDFNQIQATNNRILDSGKSEQLEETVTINDKEITYLTNKYPRFDYHGNIIGLIGIARDITERKKLQQEREELIQELETRNKELSALNLMTANAVSTLELDALLSVLLDRLVSVLNADLALIFLLEDDQLSLKAEMGEGVAFDNERGINQEIARMTINQNKLINIEDIQQDSRFSNYASNNPRKRHFISLPLKRQQHLVGTLQVVWYYPHAVTSREVHLLEIIAERCTMAILNAQLFQETEWLQKRLWLQFERTPLACIVKDAQGKITDWNSAAERLFAYTKTEVLGKETLELIVPTSQRELVQEIMNRLRAGEMDAHGITENVTKWGDVITCQWFNTPLIADNGDFIGTFSVIEDITEKVNLEQKLREYAYYDSVTKLPNRKFLKEELRNKLETAEIFPKLAILHLDLVRFKTLKYSLGYQIIEDLLIKIGETLISRIPDNSFCAKIASDEFVILLEDIETEADAIAWVETIQQLFLSPFEINEHRIFTKVKLGVVLTQQWCGSAEEILQAADTAMNQAKLSSTQDYAVFDPKMQESAIAQILMDSQMRQGLDNNEFELHYQPIVSLETQKVVGFEALLRWQKDDYKISPGQFIPIAEETGFIITLDNWVLRQACSQLQQWRLQHQKYNNLYISVNVSATELIQPNFLEGVNQVLQETGLPPHYLKLEVTETSIMENAEKVSAILEQLNHQQIRLCLDDFGTGYSSLSYLRQFPFEVMKIDRSFLSNLSDNSKHKKLIETMTLLAQNLEIGIVVEGIETQQQLAILKQLGCQNGQGYLFSRPLPRSQIETLFNDEQEIINT